MNNNAIRNRTARTEKTSNPFRHFLKAVIDAVFMTMLKKESCQYHGTILATSRHVTLLFFNDLGFVLGRFLLLGKILRQVQTGQVEQVRHRRNRLHQSAEEIGGRALSVSTVA